MSERHNLTADEPNDFAAQYEAGEGYSPKATIVERCADEGEARLREYLSEHYDREPTEAEVEWVRRFPRRVAAKNDGRDPRAPTLTEMRNEFDWGASPKMEKRLGLANVRSEYR